MTTKPNWHYDEMIPPGVDYSDPAQVAVYDRNYVDAPLHLVGDWHLTAIGMCQSPTR